MALGCAKERKVRYEDRKVASWNHTYRHWLLHPLVESQVSQLSDHSATDHFQEWIGAGYDDDLRSVIHCVGTVHDF